MSELEIRLATDADVPAIRRLVNDAYQELAERGFNYTASYQDETVTRERMAGGRTFLLVDENSLIGTIHLRVEELGSGRKCAYIEQFGVRSHVKRMGYGSRLLGHVEALAKNEGFLSVRLDTAKPAKHLVDLYRRRGYRIIGETHFEGKTYDSWIFEKRFD